ncbi:transporter substrate-binding domain-containing protein [Legionella maioricensis]|uniref:Transporter substrate-binding domain-containing protein n=1 Tax=Legionella maioricensis TaxID=2896528 RepID=A0A9X2CZX3_9GAMM|nr:transporter substrate-binding domain-containing protein [Legionella maioricensis]MCL9683876.1 transporter substrate-binding domain-containing protein [Legionella maioricensis]MCL9686723.1 transporter substrate-binding domain-containing protein [Legionella maioricensis]
MRVKIFLLALCFFFSSLGNSTINIGTLIFKPPFISSPGNGFDIDLAHLLCQRLQERCDFKPMGINELYKKLQEGKIDLAIGGIPISYSLKINFIFSLPYMLSKGQFLVQKKNRIDSIRELRGQTIGLLQNPLNGGVSYKFLLERYPGQFKIKLYNDVEDILADLSSKKITAAFLNRSSVNYWVEHGGGQFKSLGPVFTIGDGIVILALPKSKKLIERINTLIDDIEKDNTYIKLYNIYFANE